MSDKWIDIRIGECEHVCVCVSSWFYLLLEWNAARLIWLHIIVRWVQQNCEKRKEREKWKRKKIKVAGLHSSCHRHLFSGCSISLLLLYFFFAVASSWLMVCTTLIACIRLHSSQHSMQPTTSFRCTHIQRTHTHTHTHNHIHHIRFGLLLSSSVFFFFAHFFLFNVCSSVHHPAIACVCKY